METYLGDDNPYYYNVYFFSKDSCDYYTIWFNDETPERMLKERNPGVSFNYCWFQLNRNDIILVTREDDFRELPFKPCINWLDTLDIKYLPKKEPVIGKAYLFRTFKYSLQKKEVERLTDTIYMDIMEDRIENEMKYLKRENEKLKQE